MAGAFLKGTVEIDPELRRQMRRFTKEFSKRDVHKAMSRAGTKVGQEGAKLSKPGSKSRDVVARQRDPYKKEVHSRTDTVRYATHFVVFRRQGKKPYFVPVTLNPHAQISDTGTAPRKKNIETSEKFNIRIESANPDYAKYDSERRRGAKSKRYRSVRQYFDYQSRRQSTAFGFQTEYDSPSEVAAMRRIKRRGLAAQVWGRLGKKSGGGTVRVRKNQFAEKDVKKWHGFRRVKKPYREQMTLHNKLTYMRKAYGNIEPRLKGRAAHSLKREIEDRLERRAARFNKRGRKG